MKKLLFCITLTAMFAIGCGNTPQAVDSQPAQIMPATTITEVATPTPAVATEAATPVVATEVATDTATPTETITASETPTPEVATDTE